MDNDNCRIMIIVGNLHKSIIHKLIKFIFNSIIHQNVNRDNYDTNSFVSNICVGGRGGCSPPLQPKEESSIVRVGWVGELDAAPVR